jgi:hypothetical protein
MREIVFAFCENRAEFPRFSGNAEKNSCRMIVFAVLRSCDRAVAPKSADGENNCFYTKKMFGPDLRKNFVNLFPYLESL